MDFSAAFKVRPARPQQEYIYIYQSAGNDLQPLSFTIRNTGGVELKVVYRDEPALGGHEVQLPDIPSTASAYRAGVFSLRLAGAPFVDASGTHYLDGNGVIVVGGVAVGSAREHFIAPRAVRGLEWPHIYGLGNTTLRRECVLVENTGGSPISIVIRVAPDSKGREVHVDPPILPGSCMILGNVYSIRVATDDNAPQYSEGYWTVFPLL